MKKVGAPPGLIFPRILLGTTNSLILITAFLTTQPARLNLLTYVYKMKAHLRTPWFPNFDEFSENLQTGGGGGGVNFDPNNFVADFCGNFEGENDEFSGRGVRGGT